MTREEAIIQLRLGPGINEDVSEKYNDAINMAIEALSEPSKVDFRTDKSANIGTEVNDLISRADAMGCVDYWIDNDATDDAQARAVAIKNDLRYMPSAAAVQGWIPLSHDGLGTNFPYERDGEWVIVTDGKNISVERIKKDAYDHFYPNGRGFELNDVIAWMPLPTPYKGGGDE